MTRHTLQTLVKTYLGLVAVLAVAAIVGGAPPPSSPEARREQTEPGTRASTDEQNRQAAEKVVREIDLEIFHGEQWSKVERIEKPLLFYSEPTRNNDRGSVWAWGRKGRPVALIELFQGMDNRTKWAYALCNTSGGKLRARRADTPWWRENDSVTQLKDVPGAAAPAAEARVRQRQLKLLARKFTAHERWDPDNSRYELRLLQRPLCTYQDEASGLLDGGLFILANGTNPEIPLFIEARVDARNPSKRVWQYALGRLAHAELHLSYEGKEVFEAPRGNQLSAPNKPYWLGLLKAPSDAGP